MGPYRSTWPLAHGSRSDNDRTSRAESTAIDGFRRERYRNNRRCHKIELLSTLTAFFSEHDP